MSDGGQQREVRPDFAERDPAPLLEIIRQTRGQSYRVLQRYPRGAWGAWLVADASGARVVLKCVWDTDWRDRLELAMGVVDRLRERGAPVPRFLEYGHDERLGTWYLQERVGGKPLPQLTSSVLPAVLAFVDLMAGLTPARDAAWSWSADVGRVLGPGSARLELLSRAGPATAAIADAAAAFGETARWLPDMDAVHGDFLSPQIMVDASHRLVAVIDWDEAAYGSRAIDLALLFQNVEVQADRTTIPAEPAVVQTLAQRGLTIAGPGFAAAVHYHLVKMLAFVVAFNPKHVDWRLDVAARVLRNLEAARGGG